ncbi:MULTISPECIES: TetR/AcrR family transcriptional regulator [Rhodococcus]|jgi:AcrR family transcriptional regulator|uniref:TetR/AcrR family transcriptional regulator n=1 Tax=Rhodococcus qingshengii TaxID=334542 RepID=A0AAW6L982_RHOSG|nr:MULTISPECIES: TetR/AcrR family transcriptional regulator [Rhodococcus]OKA16880.1 TetR family transcriptional regulator [Rhodococcus erythropolis]KZF18576.1 TetR family transcriptional regulator [Rhodococcus sp. EPR-134]MBP1051705.1 TetR family transcriptional regulator [Rhodococcus qingshengii]MBQ7803791.1 TetR family transcriptional regulator [Rhodococcus sp. (in: high G+C Gram-positive bacteria)]MBW0287512.1 TetR family transcriptional regulator [Rhodococcus sp. FH8]
MSGAKTVVVRQLILDSAVRNMNERGYHGTSMRDISAGADLTVASIYHHFKSKQEILQEIMIRALHDAISMTRSALLRSGGDPKDQLQAIVRAWVMFHTTRREDALVGATELRSLDESGHRLVVTLRDEQESMFRDVVERGIEEGAFHTPFPRDAVRAIINMGQQVCVWWRVDGPMNAEDIASRYCALATAMIESS